MMHGQENIKLHYLLVRKFRISGAITVRPLYAFTWCRREKIYLLSHVNTLSLVRTHLTPSYAMISYSGGSWTVRRGAPQNIVFSFNLYVLFFKKATKLLGQIVIKLFGPNYLTNGSVRYSLWPQGAVKNYWDTKCTVNQGSFGKLL